MPSKIDPKMLDKLLVTVNISMPSIRVGIESFLKDTEKHEELEDAYQNMHPIIDVASMLELPLLYHLATSITEMIENIASESNLIDPKQSRNLLEVVELLEPYLRSIQNDDGQAEEIVSRAIQHYRRFQNLPESEDERAILEIVSRHDTNSEFKALSNDDKKLEEIYTTNSLETKHDFLMDFSDELLKEFIIEAEDYLDTIGRLLPEINENTQKNDQLQQVRRSVHTLKGSAGIVGLQTVSQLAHRMEDVLDDLYDGRLTFSSEIKAAMLSTFDVLEDFIRDKKAQGEIDSSAKDLYIIYDNIMGTILELPEQEKVSSIPLYIDTDTYGLNSGDTIFSSPTKDNVVTAQNAKTTRIIEQEDLIRVPIKHLDEIVGLVGELVISRSVFEQHLANLLHQVDELHLSIDRLQRTSITIETQYEVSALVSGHSTVSNPNFSGLSRAGSEWTGIVEFDELEFDRYSDFHLMSRDLTETSADIGALGGEFRDILSEFDAFLTRQSRLTSEIQDKLIHFRMIPLSSLATRLHRAVRMTAKQRGKEVRLVIEGEEVQLDKSMLDELNEALLHLLRNAVDHGIESPAERVRIGKQCEGTIHLNVFREGTQIVVQIKDDGAGLDPQRIRVKAIEKGLVSEAEIESWKDDQVYSLIFSPGFSTAQEVNEVSGRGVGMDIVHETVTRLKGRINIESSLGQGVALIIRLPVTLALTQVLLVEVNNQAFAISLADVIQVLHIEQDEIEKISDMRVININEKIIPVVFLSEVLNIARYQSSKENKLPIIVTQVENHQVALVVDQLLGGREVVVKNLGMHLHHVHGLIGSTLMGDGSIVLILNPSELIYEKKSSVNTQYLAKTSKVLRSSDSFEILIVDDSFSIRRVVANLIKKAGWEPILAKNGLEALEIIQRVTRLPDLILLDVEMPQMDGYELTSTLRAHPEYQNLPIIMLTSRSGDKHRQKAFEVGATEYVVKPYRDAILLSLVSRLILQARGVSST